MEVDAKTLSGNRAGVVHLIDGGVRGAASVGLAVRIRGARALVVAQVAAVITLKLGVRLRCAGERPLDIDVIIGIIHDSNGRGA